MKKTAIICRDSAPGFFLSLYVRKNSKKKFIFCCKNPALNILKDYLGNFKNYNIDEAIKKSTNIIVGTGKTEFEKKIMLKLVKQNKEFTCFVDHSSNFRNRFSFRGFKIYPKKLWTVDSITNKEIKKHFPNSSIKIINLKNNLSKKKIKKYFILYLAGCMSLKNKKLKNKFKSFIHAEKKALKTFLDFISKNNIFFKDKKILARLHPEEFYKRKIIKELKDKNILLSKKNLLNDIEDSNYIFGGNSTSLIYAKKLNKIVVNCLSKNQILQKNYNILIKEFLINAN